MESECRHIFSVYREVGSDDGEVVIITRLRYEPERSCHCPKCESDMDALMSRQIEPHMIELNDHTIEVDDGSQCNVEIVMDAHTIDSINIRMIN